MTTTMTMPLNSRSIEARDDPTTIADRRERVRASVTRWTDRIAAGAYLPSPAELAAVVELCQDYFLPVEAARVMRWMTP